MMPVSTPTSVDLPAPFRPTSARESPAGTRIETSLSAWLVPKRLETPDTSTIAAPGAVASGAGCSPLIIALLEGSRVGSVLSAVRPEARIVDVGLGHCRRRQQIHRVAVDDLDAAVMVGRAGAEALAGNRAFQVVQPPLHVRVLRLRQARVQQVLADLLVGERRAVDA